MSKKVIIVGGVACGGKTAARLMRIDPEAEITILERGDYLSYAGCGLPYYVGDVVKEYKDLMTTGIGVVRNAAFFRKVKHVDVHTGHLATSVDLKRKEVTAKILSSGEERTFPYDYLVLATGASPVTPPIPGIDHDDVFTLWTMSDAIRMRQAIDSGRIKKAAIIGGGLIGMEVVEALHDRGIQVSVVEMLDRPLGTILDENFGASLLKKFREKGVKFFGGEKAVEITCDKGCGAIRGIKTDAREIECDMVLMAVGVRPNTELAEKAGLLLGDRKGVLVDEHMRTSDPYVFAGGDCVETFNRITGSRTWQPMGSTANRQGRVIADNIAGMGSKFKGVIGTAIMKAFDYTVGRTGLSERTAKDAGFDPIGITVTAPDRPHFMPGNGPLTMRILADKTSRKIIGGQFIGRGVVDKRLDGLITAITGGMTVDELADTDLAYAPPFATALDPLTHGANSLKNKMDGLLHSYSPSELIKRMEDMDNPPVLLDVRTPAELNEQGRLPYRSLNIPLGDLWERWKDLPKDREIITFCKISVRGWDAYGILKRLGFSDISLLEGGILGWPYDLDRS